MTHSSASPSTSYSLLSTAHAKSSRRAQQEDWVEVRAGFRNHTCHRRGMSSGKWRIHKGFHGAQFCGSMCALGCRSNGSACSLLLFPLMYTVAEVVMEASVARLAKAVDWED